MAALTAAYRTSQRLTPENPASPAVPAPKVATSIATRELNDTGYCRIFPPTFNTVNDLTEQWKAEFWAGPSPWCKVEGSPEHPEFEANLAALERALS